MDELKYFHKLRRMGESIDPRLVVVVETPDYNGGWDYEVRSPEEGVDMFEYVEWEGSPAELAWTQPTFMAHKEPFHEEPYDIERDAEYLLEKYFA